MSKQPVARRQSLAQRMSWAVTAVLLLVVSIFVIQTAVLDRASSEARRVIESARAQESRLWRMMDLADRMAWLRSPEQRSEVAFDLTNTILDFSPGMTQLPTELLESGLGLEDRVIRLQVAARRWEVFRDSLQRVAESPGPAEAVAIMQVPRFHEQFREIREALQEAAREVVLRTGERAISLLVYQVGLTLLVFLVVLWTLGLSRALSARLQVLVGVARQLTAGNLEARAPVTGNDETADLAEALNVLAERVHQPLTTGSRVGTGGGGPRRPAGPPQAP